MVSQAFLACASCSEANCCTAASGLGRKEYFTRLPFGAVDLEEGERVALLADSARQAVVAFLGGNAMAIAHLLQHGFIEFDGRPIGQGFGRRNEELRPSAVFKGVAEAAQGNRVAQGETPTACAAQAHKMRTDAELFADVVGQRAHISARGTMYVNHNFGESPLEEFETMHVDDTRGEVNFFAATRHLVGFLAADFHRRIRRRSLFDLTDEVGKQFRELLAGHVDRNFRFAGNAFGVIGVGGGAQLDGGLVALILGGDEIAEAYRGPNEYHQHARGARVEGTSVTCAADAGAAADDLHHVVRGQTHRLVHHEHARYEASNLILFHTTSASPKIIGLIIVMHLEIFLLLNYPNRTI